MAGADNAVVQGLPFDDPAGPVMARLQVLCGLLLGATCTFSNTNSSQIWSYLTGLNIFFVIRTSYPNLGCHIHKWIGKLMPQGLRLESLLGLATCTAAT